MICICAPSGGRSDCTLCRERPSGQQNEPDMDRRCPAVPQDAPEIPQKVSGLPVVQDSHRRFPSPYVSHRHCRDSPQRRKAAAEVR